MAAAAILFVRASSLNDQANTEPNVRMRNDLHGQADTRATIGAVVGIAGLVIATTGAIYLLVTDRHARTPLNTVFLGIGVSGHGINVHGRF